MKHLLLVFIASLFMGAVSTQHNVKQMPIGTFSGPNATLCYTGRHLNAIMTYFSEKGEAFWGAAVYHNETEGFYI